MTDDSDLFLFADEDSILFSPEPVQNEEPLEKWKLLIVDDEQEVHSVTRMVLDRFSFDGRSLQLFSAYSGEDARKLMAEHPDMAIVFMDVVMEKDDAGLAAIRYIREELKNPLVRIILRTGQPGQAPEEKVIVEYDINDYKEKTELTAQKLFTSVISALRAYRDLVTLDTGKRGLGKIIDAYAEIFFEQSQKNFALKVLKRLDEIIGLNRYGESRETSCFAAERVEGAFYILAARGIYSEAAGRRLEEVLDPEILHHLQSAFQLKKNIYLENALILYIHSKAGEENLIYVEGCGKVDDFKKDLIDVFCFNVSAIHEAILFSVSFETEKQQRLLAETLRDLNRRLTSTLSLEEVLARLLCSLSQIVNFKQGLGLAKKEDGYVLLAVEGENALSLEEYHLNGLENEIVQMVQSSKLPASKAVTEPGAMSCLGVPILYHHDLFGIILLSTDSHKGFEQRDMDFASAFASQAGGAMENAILYEEVMDRNADIENILDNAGQGFLTFGSDMRVNNEYSAECISIFGKRIEGIPFPALIYTDEEQCSCLKAMLFKTMNLKSSSMLEIYLPLLPGEIQVDGKFIHLEYKIIDGQPERENKLFMVVLTDVTEKKFLENKVEEERKILKMVVKAVTSQSDLTRCCKDFRRFSGTGLKAVLDSDRTLEDKEFEILRSVHTFKGSFSQLDMVYVVGKLHDLESDITEKRGKEGFPDLDTLRRFILSYPMASWLEEDLKSLYEILGENFLEHEKAIFVDEMKIQEIERKMEAILPPEQCALLLPEIRQLRYSPANELFKHYPGYVARISEKLGKYIHPFAIEGGDTLVDGNKISDFTGTLVHVFRNAIDHGIESPEERKKAGKEEYGTISCRIERLEKKLVISISDDGRGICEDQLRKSAVSKKLYDENAVKGMTRDQVLTLIFEDCFSTKDGVTELSGRGIGLSAVKNALEKAGGTLAVETVEGQGTRFIFTLLLA